MGETDIAFRHLVRALPRPILHLAFPHRTLEPRGVFDSSVDRPRKRTSDNLFRARDDDHDVAVHVELERGWRPTIAPRLFDYASSAVSGTALPVWTIVVLTEPGGDPPAQIGTYRIPGADGDAFVFRYHVVHLWQLDARAMREVLGVEGAPFCVAMRGADEAFVRELAEDVHRSEGARRDRDRVMPLLYVMSAAMLGPEAARRIFHMESIIQHPNVQAIIGEWAEQGREKGHAEGHAEGLEKGRAEEARRMLYKFLGKHGIVVSDETRASVEAETQIEQLERWIERAVTARSIDEVFS